MSKQTKAKKTVRDVEEPDFFRDLADACEKDPEEGQATIGTQLRSLLEQVAIANRSAATIRGKLFAEGESSDPKKEAGNKSIESLVYNFRVELGDLVKQLASINSRL